MNQLAKLTLLVAVASGTTSALAISYEHQKAVNDNWGNGSEDLVWENGTGELCWSDSEWSPATANRYCGAAVVAPTPVAKTALVTPTAAPAPAPVVASATVEKITYSADALFDFDKAVLKPGGKMELDGLMDKIKDVTVEVIVATGHTDAMGPEAYNEKLSMRRAEAVKDYLMHKGVAEGAIRLEGKGESQPVASNATRMGRAQNRRVEIEVVGKRTVMPGSEPK